MFESLISVLMISLGSALGATLRIEFIRLFNLRFIKDFPVTILINIIATFLLGSLVAFERQNINHLLINNDMLFFKVGVLGSFSTFSAFILEVFQKIKIGKIFDAFCIVFISLFGGLLSAFLGYKIFYAR